MNKSTESTSGENFTIEPHKKPWKRTRFLDIFTFICIILIAGGYVLGSNKFKEAQINSSYVKDDLVFLNGFEQTGKEWPPTEDSWSLELKMNPLAKLREAYCIRIGYKYADFSANCFHYQYFDSFKTYTDSGEKLTVYYPALWQEDAVPINHTFVSSSKMSLQRNGASCAISHGLIDEDSITALRNASTTKVNYDGQLLSGTMDTGLAKITLPFTRKLTNEEIASGYTNKKLIAFPHFPYSNSTYGFLLTSGEKQPLAEACVSEFNSMLSSRSINYPTTNLTSESNGFLYLRDMRSWFESYANIPQQPVFIFNNQETGKEEAIAHDAFVGTTRIAAPFFSNGKLYLIAYPKETAIISIDIMTGEKKNLLLTNSEDTTVHSYFVEGNNLYYLTGRKSCATYRASCDDLVLQNYNLASNTSEILFDGIGARDIVGLNSSKSRLILSWREGDAGCAWGKYLSFTFSDKTIDNLGSYSFCAEDEEDTSAPFENLVTNTDRFDHLKIENGKIFLPSEKKNASGIYIQANTDEYSQK